MRCRSSLVLVSEVDWLSVQHVTETSHARSRETHLSSSNPRYELHPLRQDQPYKLVSVSSLHTQDLPCAREKMAQQINILSALMAPFLLLLFPLCAAASDQHVTVHPGDDVTLRCEAGDVSIGAVEWTRPDLKPQYVFLYRDGNLDPTKQHPSFTGRVELVDRELKGGDVSLTLKNVTSRDSGTYECRVRSDGSRRTERAIIKTAPITVIHLEVRGAEKEHSMGGNTESEHPVNGNFPHLYVGLAAGGVAVLLVAAAVFAVWRYKRRTDQRSEQSAAAEAGNNQFMFPSAVCDSST